MGENNLEKKISASKTNLQVCSILLAAISLSLKLSDLSKMRDLVRICITISIWMAMALLSIAIVLEADAVYYYSRKNDELGDYFDRYGYQVMKVGLLFVLVTMNYLASSIIPPIISVSAPLSELLQASVPALVSIISYLIWVVFKFRKVRAHAREREGSTLNSVSA